jgi:hypothetical protein
MLMLFILPIHISPQNYNIILPCIIKKGEIIYSESKYYQNEIGQS